MAPCDALVRQPLTGAGGQTALPCAGSVVLDVDVLGTDDTLLVDELLVEGEVDEVLDVVLLLVLDGVEVDVLEDVLVDVDVVLVVEVVVVVDAVAEPHPMSVIRWRASEGLCSAPV